MKSILTVIFSFVFIASGFSQTRNVVVGTNDVIVQPTNFWSANASNGRTGLGLGSAATNPASAFQPSSTVLTNLASNNAASLTNISISNVVNLQSSLNEKLSTNGDAVNLTNFPTILLRTNGNGSGLTNLTASNVTGTVAISNGGSGATNDGGARTNFGLTWTGLTNVNASGFRSALELSASWLTNTNVTNFRTAIGLGASSEPDFQGVTLTEDTNSFQLSAFAGVNRTNLGLGWPALTNTNAGTALVSVNTNGEVVSPTNFWQAAPIQTVVQTFAPVTNSTNTGTNARNLYAYSLATNIVGVTNVIVLQTNTAVFAGDNATVIHRGTTNSTTAIRQAGASTNLITISNYDDAIKFIYENGSWDFYHNISFVEPIKFTDGNLEVNKAISRTNLGLPLQALTNTNAATFQQDIFTTNSAPTNTATPNTVNFTTAIAWMEVSIVTNNVTNSYRIPLFK